MRRFSQLTTCDRVAIAKWRRHKLTVSEIARRSGFHKSTISRELRRNSRRRVCWWLKGANGQRLRKERLNQNRTLERISYEAPIAQQKRNARIHASGKKRPGAISSETEAWILSCLKMKWSPDQIAGRAFIDRDQNVSHQYIYNMIKRDKQNGGTLYQLLRRWREKKRRTRREHRSKIQGRISISERPKIVDQRKRLGDLEADLIVGHNHGSYMLVVTDRVSRYARIKQLKSKATSEVVRNIISLSRDYHRPRTITVDNGLEFAGHRRITAETGMKVYFTDAFAAWQKGSIENLNGLLRQYIPKKTDLRTLTQSEVMKIENALNNRPRKCLGYRSPRERQRRLAQHRLS